MIERLSRSPADRGTLVIQVVDAEPFVQFTGGPSGVEMDFPVITEPQRARKEPLRRFFEANGLRVRATFGDNGAEFLDVDLPADAARIAALTQAVLTEVCQIPHSAQLRFMGQGLGVAA